MSTLSRIQVSVMSQHTPMTVAERLSAWMNFLKGLAIIGVVAFHFFGDRLTELATAPDIYNGTLARFEHVARAAFLQATHVGSQGIHVFFFLSGFGLALSERKAMLAPRQFLLRRLSRIYPAFLLALVLVVAYQLVSGLAHFDAAYAEAIAANVLLLRNYSTQWIRTINGNWWFVAAIVPMYVMHLFCRGYYRAHPARGLVVAFCLSLAYKLAIIGAQAFELISFDAGQLNPYTAFFLNYWWIFVAGYALSCLDLFARLNALRWRGLTTLALVGCACEAVGVWLGYSAVGRVFNDDFFAVALLCLFSVMAMASMRWPRLQALVGAIGVSSYGLYLIHHPLSRALHAVMLPSESLVSTLMLFVVYFAACFFLGKLIEDSAARWSDALLQRRSK